MKLTGQPKKEDPFLLIIIREYKMFSGYLVLRLVVLN